jgi:anti-sigma regulatory factor (Ser/Thr protein kinase)
LATPNKLVYARFPPVWTYVDSVREFCRAFCTATFGSEDIGERLSIVLSEALENAVRYSRADASDVEISIDSDGQRVMLSVENQPDERHLARLRQEFDYIQQTEPKDGYEQALLHAAEGWDAGPPGLGLARMRLEGSVELYIFDLENGRIRVVAAAAL